MTMSIATTEHTVKAFDTDLQMLDRMIAEMGEHAHRQLMQAVGALKKRDRDCASEVVGNDAALDVLQREIERRAIATIATRQPMAVDLREVVGVLRIATELERIGDLAKNIAKRVIALDGQRMPRHPLKLMSHMTAVATDLLRDVLASYAARDSGKAQKVWSSDREIDWLYNQLFREVLNHMMGHPAILIAGVHLLFCAKNIERVGDHATNIAESVYYIVHGQPLPGERPKMDSTGLPTLPARAPSIVSIA
jgi:phosphate transport system protein